MVMSEHQDDYPMTSPTNTIAISVSMKTKVSVEYFNYSSKSKHFFIGSRSLRTNASTLGRVKCAIPGCEGACCSKTPSETSKSPLANPDYVFGSKESEGIRVNEIPWSFNETKAIITGYHRQRDGQNG